ncbi:hypothetical protein R6U77_12710 [Lysinibacillus louembei]|uniref:Uncharacterized protein n=1 Tax=Lysinibacillus louembei TaxID=1470088 RepID=A0ABZ0RTV1_9BACI|nr:hypothetical protein [Lysinibacillus louembei]WPK10741.1 hypothetical protein R6U77_12710 [Lysinibacillus louembei]
MEREDKYKQLEIGFKKLNDEGKNYILGIMQALEFAQSNQVADGEKYKENKPIEDKNFE